MFCPVFTITNQLLSDIAKIEAAKQIIENAPLIPDWERRFRQQAEERTIYFSTKIEGNKLDFDEAKRVISGEGVKTFRRRDIQEIVNYRETIQYICGLQKQPLDEKLILNVHKKIMNKILPPSELGNFRTCEEALISSETQEVISELTPPEYISGGIEDLLSWIGSVAGNVHPIIKAGITLYELLRIHPFTDGNGRTARIIATFCLYSDGYDIKRFFSLEEYYDQNLEQYYEALGSVENNEGDLSTWLEFFAKGLAIELDRIKSKILDISSDIKLRNSIGQVALNKRQLTIVDFIQEQGSVQNRDWQELFPSVSDDTILRDLRDLIDKGVVGKQGRTKAARYVLR